MNNSWQSSWQAVAHPPPPKKKKRKKKKKKKRKKKGKMKCNRIKK